MLFILAFVLIAVLFVAFITTRGDLFSPEVMMTIAFLLSTICAIYQLRIWNYDIGFKSASIIVLALLLAIFVGLVVRNYSIHKPRVLESLSCLSSIPDWALVVCLLVVLSTCAAMAYQVQRIGGTGELTDVMLNFRQENAYGTDLTEKLPGWVSQLQNLTSVIGYLFIFNMLCCSKKISSGRKAINVLIIALSVLASMMTGGRFGTLCMVLGGLAMFWVLYYRHHGGASVRMSTVLKVFGIVVLVLFAFYFVKDYVGRDSDADLIEYLTHYMGGSIVGFDMYLNNPPAPSEIFGKETFYSLINGLRKFGLIDVPYYLIHHEFRVSNGTGIGNIYTALRDYHYDFDFFGMFVLHAVFCFVMSSIYERMKRGGSGRSLVIFGMMYYCIPMYSISNCFYSNIISFGFFIKLVEALVLYRIFFERNATRQAQSVQCISTRSLVEGEGR